MSTPLIGQRLSKYEIQAEIGRGGMGIVYRGYDTMLQRPVAVKVLPPTFSFDQEFVARFQREAVLAANLHHPHIVTIHDVGEQAGNHYIVMELLEGETLDHWLHRYGAMTPPQAGQLLQQLASALDYAHGRGIVHRDIKPSNIMLSPDGQVKLMDFGLVRAGEGSQLTRSGVVLGTPEYMAPEQALGESVDGRADVYALGVVLYRMLTGHVPFSRSTPYAVTYAHIHEPPPPLRTLRPDLPPAVEAVVLKALAKQPAERYGRAGQLAQDFQAAAQFGAYPAAGAGVAAAAAMRPPADQRAAPVAGGAQAKRTPPARTPPPPPATASMRKQRSLLPLFMALVVALLAVVIGAFWLLNRRDGEQPAVTAGQPAVELPAETLAAPPTPSPSPSPVEELAPTLAPEVVVSAEQPEPTQPPTSEAVPPTSTPLPQPTATQPPTREPATTVAPTNTSAPTATQPVAVVGGQALNVRSGPGTDYPVVGQLSRGARAEISGRNADSSWWQVVLASGAEGWVLASLVTVEGAVDQIAVAAVPTRPPTPTPPPTPPRPGLVFDFERDVLWKRGDQPYGTLQRSAEQVKAGAAAGKLSYDFAAVPDNYVVLMPQPAPALGNATGVVAWVHGDGSGHMLNAWVRDSGGEVRSYTFGRISHSGWAPMTAWFDDQAGWPNGHISGSDNGRLDPPSTLTALVLDAVPDGQASRGAIYIDEVTVTQEAIQQATPTPASLPPPSATTSSATLTRPPSAAQLAGLSGWLSVGAVFGLALAVDRRRRPAGCWRRWRRR